MLKIITALGLACLLLLPVYAKELSSTALYRVDKIQHIAKKSDDKCVDNAAKTCERVGYWKVKYKALDSLVPHQYHDVKFADDLPQLGAVVQLTLPPMKKI